MMKRALKHRLLRAKIKLNHTLKQILDINYRRRKLPYLPNPANREAALEEELKVLNRIADQQARLVRYYEVIIYGNSVPPHGLSQ